MADELDRCDSARGWCQTVLTRACARSFEQVDAFEAVAKLLHRRNPAASIWTQCHRALVDVLNEVDDVIESLKTAQTDVSAQILTAADRVRAAAKTLSDPCQALSKGLGSCAIP